MEERSAVLLAQVKESVREGSATVRCNPVECDCPPLEIRVADRWIRVDVVDSSDPDLPVEGIVRFCKAEAAGPLPQSHTWQVDLKSSSVRWCANGTPYFELALKSLNPDAE
ncbi:MAG: hypothetical protein FJ109_18620 [Deltaproteobacteria bacterium]|nr:hypothetical protein [Deltaproteobacteria bacterium]